MTFPTFQRQALIPQRAAAPPRTALSSVLPTKMARKRWSETLKECPRRREDTHTLPHSCIVSHCERFHQIKPKSAKNFQNEAKVLAQGPSGVTSNHFSHSWSQTTIPICSAKWVALGHWEHLGASLHCANLMLASRALSLVNIVRRLVARSMAKQIAKKVEQITSLFCSECQGRERKNGRWGPSPLFCAMFLREPVLVISGKTNWAQQRTSFKGREGGGGGREGNTTKSNSNGVTGYAVATSSVNGSLPAGVHQCSQCGRCQLCTLQCLLGC